MYPNNSSATTRDSTPSAGTTSRSNLPAPNNMPPMNRVRRVSGMRNLIQRSPQVSFAEQAPPPRPPKTRGSVDLMFDLAEGYVRNRQHIQPSSHSEGQGAQQRQFKQTGPEPEQHDPAKDHATATTPKLEPAQREGGRVPSLKSLIPSKTASSSLKPGTGSSAEERGHTFSQRVVPADKVTTSPPPRPRRSSRRGLVKKLSIGLTYRDQNPPQALARDAADALTCQPTRNLHIAAVVQSTSDTAHEPNHIVPRQRRNAISHGSGVSRSGALPFPELQTPKAISQEDAVDNENGQSKDCGNHEHHNGENLQNVALQPGATQPTSNQEANETVLDGQAGKWQPFRKSFIRGTQTDQRAQPAVRERKISFSSIVSKGSGTTRAISRTLRKSLARQEPAIRLEEDSTENVGATSNVKNTAKCDPTSTLTHVAPQDADIVPQDSASTAENLIKAKESLNDSLTDCESRCAQTAFSTITAVSLGAEANTSLDDTWPPEQLAAVVAKVEARAAADGVDLDTVSIDLDWGATRPMTFRRRVSELVSAGTAMSNEEMAFWERNKFRASIFGVEGIDFSEKLPWRVYSSGKSPKDKPTWPTKTEASGGGVLGSELDLRDVTYGNSLAFQARQQAAGNARAHQSEAPPPTPPGSSTSEVMPRATNSREASREHEHDTPLPRGVLRGAYHTTLTVDTQPTAYLMTQLFQPDVSTSLESEDMNLTALGLASPTTPTTSAQEYLVRGVLRSRAAPLPAPRVVSDPPSHQQSTTARMVSEPAHMPLPPSPPAPEISIPSEMTATPVPAKSTQGRRIPTPLRAAWQNILAETGHAQAERVVGEAHPSETRASVSAERMPNNTQDLENWTGAKHKHRSLVPREWMAAADEQAAQRHVAPAAAAIYTPAAILDDTHQAKRKGSFRASVRGLFKDDTSPGPSLAIGWGDAATIRSGPLDSAPLCGTQSSSLASTSHQPTTHAHNPSPNVAADRATDEQMPLHPTEPKKRWIARFERRMERIDVSLERLSQRIAPGLVKITKKPTQDTHAPPCAVPQGPDINLFHHRPDPQARHDQRSCDSNPKDVVPRQNTSHLTPPPEPNESHSRASSSPFVLTTDHATDLNGHLTSPFAPEEPHVPELPSHAQLLEDTESHTDADEHSGSDLEGLTAITEMTELPTISEGSFDPDATSTPRALAPRTSRNKGW